jgi:hypothetical protein
MTPKIRTLAGAALLLYLSLSGAVYSQFPPDLPSQERGRERIGSDGRTYTDPQYKYSIRLPAPDWKVYQTDEAPNPTLGIGDPGGKLILVVEVKILPGPLERLKETAEAYAKKNQDSMTRSILIHPNGLNCWELENQTPLTHKGEHIVIRNLGRICDLDPLHKLSVSVRLPMDWWKAKEQAIGEMIDSLRVLR